MPVEGSFFDNYWIGKEVGFSRFETSKWRIKRQHEKLLMFTPLDLKTGGGLKIPYSQAVFLCKKVDDDNKDDSRNKRSTMES